MIFDQVSSVTSPVVTAVVLRETRPSLLDLYGGANAAYSLRNLSLAWRDQDVVEVRRASDDTTSGFTATEVSNGSMEQWVNATITKPLDLKELNPVTGQRDGAAITAAAAYSLRDLTTSRTNITSNGDTGGDTSGAWVVQVRRDSDDDLKSFTADEVADGDVAEWVNDVALPLDTASGAAAAYSLRNLSTSYSGDVVDVRRSSDDTEESFTAAEVADGTLLDWVTNDITLVNESSFPTDSGKYNRA